VFQRLEDVLGAVQAKALGQERQFYMPRVTQAMRIPHKPKRLAKACAASSGFC
jgi:hypothetical protein